MNPIIWPIINSVGMLALATIVGAYLKRTASTDERLGKIEGQIAVLGVQVSPLWAAVQSKIAKDLTHPSPQFQEMDELLRQLEALTIGDEDRERLEVLLVERMSSTDPEVSDDERASAKLMIGVMRKVLEEAASSAPLGQVQAIGIREAEEPK
jgi:hypothetical protein